MNSVYEKMLFFCKCLNVTINVDHLHETQQLDNEKIKNSIIRGGIGEAAAVADTTFLAAEQQQSKIKEGDHLQFFKKALGPFSNAVTNYQQIDLVQIVPVNDQWNVHQCINCECITHAVMTSKQLCLINVNMQTNSDNVNYLKNNVNFSKNFGILMNQNVKDILNSDKNDNIEARTKNLTQNYRNAIQKEIEATDERIRQFSEQQFVMLKFFREKAEQEYNDLVRMIRNVPEIKTITTINLNSSDGFATAKLPSLETPPATPDSMPMSIGNSPNFKQQPGLTAGVTTIGGGGGGGKQLTPLKSSIRHSSSIKSPQQQRFFVENSSADSDFLFDMDGVTSNDKTSPFVAVNAMSDVEESDDDEDDDLTTNSISIQRPIGRPKSLSIAQSLPICVPTLHDRLSVDDEDYDEYNNAEDNLDIAASIKALAKSVHGDAVFGDLPRPRYGALI